MGWKGTVRSFGAAVCAAERNAKRRQRELERRQKQYRKTQELEQAAYEVDVYENYIEVIQSIHKECSPAVYWNQIALSKQLRERRKSSAKEDAARLKIDRYKPGLIDRIKRERILLEQQVAIAIKADENDYKKIISIWEKEVDEWKENVGMAEALLKGDAQAKIEAIGNLAGGYGREAPPG